jgi:hypothetical protein
MLTSRRIGSTLIGIGILLLLVPAVSQAASWRVRNVPVAGPTLLGKQVGWVAPRHDEGGDLIEAKSGKSPRRIQTFSPGPSPGEGVQPVLGFEVAGSTSDAELFVSRHCISENPANGCGNSLNVLTGAVGSPLNAIEHCEGFPSWLLGGIDVSGRLAAFPRCDGKLIVRDLSGNRPDLVLGTQTHTGRIAGRYVAWIDGPYDPASSPRNAASIVVYDRRAAAVAYTIPQTEIAGQVRSLALEGHGRIAVSFDPKPDDTRVQAVVKWASPDHPHLRRVPVPIRPYYLLKIAGGRIAFLRSKNNPDAPNDEVGVAKLDGRTQLITKHAALVSDLDFDGRTVAYVTRAKHRIDVRTRPIQ